jgi:hypothetical protein
MTRSLPVYVPPTGDGPLDLVEEALVRALVPILSERIRERLARGEDLTHEPRDTDKDHERA